MKPGSLRDTSRDTSMTVYGPPIAGCVLLAATLLLFPNRTQIADAIRRATTVWSAPVTIAPPQHQQPLQTLDMLQRRFSQGKRMSVPELRQLLANSTPTATAESLSMMADRIAQTGAPVSTEQITQDILASGRPAVAKAFFETRPDRGLASLWRLRFEIRRETKDVNGAQELLQTAARNPGVAPPQDLIEAAYELDQPETLLETLIVAAERGSIPRLTRAQALDMAQRAANARRYDLIPRIDRAGTPDWRLDTPWLAMNLAQRSGDTAAALRYAALLLSGRATAREAIIMASGDGQAIRALLLDHGRTAQNGRAAIAQQLLEAGFRSDAIGLLRLDAAGYAPDEPVAGRLLYLMGPRPDAGDLAWLRSRAAENPRWLPVYAERERPAVALAFIEVHPRAADTQMLLLRLQLASAARDRQATTRAITSLLDGRALTGPQLSSAAATLPAGIDSRFTLALARARVEVKAALPTDRLDLAWDAWNRGNIRETSDQLQAHLQLHPDDLTALRLMAEVETKRQGSKAARPWLERALAQAPERSRERAEILERLGRTSEAIAIVEMLRRASPGDRRLAIVHARLLIAAGDPGRAQKLLRP